MLLINILSRSLHKGRNTVILHGWAIAFISEDLLKINTPSLYISCNCQHLKMQSDKFWHNTWKILYVNILKRNLTLRPSHLKASPLTPSSWASCCALLTNRAFCTSHVALTSSPKTGSPFETGKYSCDHKQSMLPVYKAMGLLCPNAESKPATDPGHEAGADAAERGQKFRTRRWQWVLRSLSELLSTWHRTTAVAVALNMSSLGWHVFQRVAMCHPNGLLFITNLQWMLH